MILKEEEENIILTVNQNMSEIIYLIKNIMARDMMKIVK
jgi:hypothetical protein